MSMLADMSQNERLDKLERERPNSRVSTVLQSLKGQECTVLLDFAEVRAKIIDVDADWIMLTVYGKKQVQTFVRRLSDVGKITLDKEMI